MMDSHVVNVTWYGICRYKATCENCNWTGPVRRTNAGAVIDGTGHLIDTFRERTAS